MATNDAAWIFQANPNLFDLAGAVASLKELVWEARQHADQIEPGHTAFLWQTGKGGGLLARGTILTAPAMIPLPGRQTRRAGDVGSRTLRRLVDDDAVPRLARALQHPRRRIQEQHHARRNRVRPRRPRQRAAEPQRQNRPQLHHGDR